jgi:uncharacterized repeat protein (TIGR03803 family)
MKAAKTASRLVLAGGLWLFGFSSNAAVVLTNLVSFSNPYSMDPRALIQATDGNLYGTTWGAGTYSNGMVFRLTTGGALTTLASFDGTNGTMGEVLIQGVDGNFYGTTYATSLGQPGFGNGTVFRMAPDGALTYLHHFNGTNGSGPLCLIQGSDGDLYGTTRYGGSGFNYPSTRYGTIFRISTNGTFSSLVSFDGTNGSLPYQMIQATDGNFYGVTMAGGIGFNGASEETGGGTVFQMTPEGILTTFAFFPSNAMDSPLPIRLIQSRNGNFYGTTYFGGSSNCGTIFSVAPGGTLTTLFSFTGTNGYGPSALIEGSAGNLYGTTDLGGPGELNGHGTVFQMTPSGVLTTSAWFTSTNGSRPQTLGFIQANNGNFYGTTQMGGSFDQGTIFRLSAPLAPVFRTPTQGGGLLNLTWSSVAGQSYQLQFNSDLSSTNWINSGSVLQATNGLMSASGVIGPEDKRFYRVEILP